MMILVLTFLDGVVGLSTLIFHFVFRLTKSQSIVIQSMIVIDTDTHRQRHSFPYLILADYR